MVVAQLLRALDDRRQVRLHQLRHHIQIPEPVPVQWRQNGFDPDHVFVLQEPEQPNLTQSALGVHLSEDEQTREF